MPVPGRERWISGYGATALNRALGIRGEDIGQGFVAVRVEPLAASIDERDAVDSLAITTAADQALVSAVGTTVDHQRVEMNGTAELNLSYVARPAGAVRVEARVVHRAGRVALIAIEARDEDGALIALGRGTYSLRPAAAAR